MKKVTLFAAALVCACILTAGMVSATQVDTGPRFSAGLSPKLAVPGPRTEATLTTDANRLIRWEGWLNVDAFAVSVLAQMQLQVENGTLPLGLFDMSEESIAAAVVKAMKANPTFVINPSLPIGEGGESFEMSPLPKLYVWTYRHNYGDTGLYQLYVSVKGKMLIGTQLSEKKFTESFPHEDIQALGYEFGNDGRGTGTTIVQEDVYADVEIWRGAVVRIAITGAIVEFGDETGVVVPPPPPASTPVSAWERAPSLIGNWNFNPRNAQGELYWNPLDHIIKINSNTVQLYPGNSSSRVGGTVQQRLFKPKKHGKHGGGCP